MDKLKAMATFVEVARWGSLARAAKELHVSRPLVSHQLKLIEEHLGARLINRTSRQFSLTEVGLEYLALCRSVISQVQEKEADISQIHGSPRGTIRVVSSLAFGNYVLAPIAASFMKLYEDISITLVVTDNHISRHQLGDQSHDIAFVMDRVEDSTTTVTTRVGAIQWIPCATPSYLSRFAPIQQPEDLSAHNCLSHRSNTPPGIWRFQRGADAVDISIRGTLFSNSVMVLREGALADIGIAMLPLYCIDQDLAQGRLVQILKGFEPAPKPVHVIYPHSTVPQKTRVFIDYCRRSLQPAGG